MALYISYSARGAGGGGSSGGPYLRLDGTSQMLGNIDVNGYAVNKALSLTIQDAVTSPAFDLELTPTSITLQDMSLGSILSLHKDGNVGVVESGLSHLKLASAADIILNSGSGLVTVENAFVDMQVNQITNAGAIRFTDSTTASTRRGYLAWDEMVFFNGTNDRLFAITTADATNYEISSSNGSLNLFAPTSSISLTAPLGVGINTDATASLNAANIQLYTTGSSIEVGNILSMYDNRTATMNKIIDLADGTVSTDAINLGQLNAKVPQSIATTASPTFANLNLSPSGALDTTAVGTLAIGTGNANIINIGNSGATVNIQGTTLYENVTQLQVRDPLITLNKGGATGSGSNSGIEIEEAGVIKGYVETSADRNSWIIKAPAQAGEATISPGASGITLNQSSHNPVTIGTANGLSLSTQVLSLGTASSSTTGALTSADWSTFNGKAANTNFVGDTGTGGTAGLVPAPAAGDAAAGKYLRADGTWSANTSKANVTLNNLTTTAINASLLPASDHSATVLLGSTSLRWNAAYIKTISDGTSTNSIDFSTGTLKDSAAATQLTWSTSGVAITKMSNLTTNGVVTATSADGTLATVAPGTSGNVLTSNGTAWVSSAPTGSPVVATVRSSTTLTTAANTPAVFPTVMFDTHNAYSVSNGKYTVPVGGYYRVSIASFESNAGAGATNPSAQIIKNGAAIQNIAATGTSAYAQPVSGSHIVQCVAGDTLGASWSDASGLYANSSVRGPSMSIERISG